MSVGSRPLSPLPLPLFVSLLTWRRSVRPVRVHRLFRKSTTKFVLMPSPGVIDGKDGTKEVDSLRAVHKRQRDWKGSTVVLLYTFNETGGLFSPRGPYLSSRRLGQGGLKGD